jgi:trimeric autotransporter adhesin
LFTRFAKLMFALVPVLLATGLSAQTYYGLLNGIVSDERGNAVVGAEVTITNVAMGKTRSTITNRSGEYLFNAVDPGTFDVAVQAAGFGIYKRMSVLVATQQAVTIDFSLKVESTKETVEVLSNSVQLDTASASNGQVLSSQQIAELPNIGRNPYLLAKLTPTVTVTGDPRFTRFQDQSGAAAISVAGGPIASNNYEVDGVSITNMFNQPTIMPSIEAVQEVKIQSNTYDAEMGRAGGGNFNTLLKTGSRDFHGNLFGTTRQTDWSANTWNNNYTGKSRPDVTQYNYEGSVGGYIAIPHLYKGREKTFFWLTSEGYRQRSPLSANYYLPSDLERSGDFSNSYLASGVPLAIYDPATTDASGNRQQFSGNKIPSSRMTSQQSVIAQNLLKALPRCSTNCTADGYYGAVNFRPTTLLGDRSDEFIGKISQQLTKKWTAHTSFMYYGSKEPGGAPLGSFAGDGNTYILYRNVDATAVNSTYMLNPTTIILGNWGFNRYPSNRLDMTSNYDQAQLGFPASYVEQLQKAAFPRITLSQEGTQIGSNQSGLTEYYSRNLTLGMMKNLRHHALKIGYQYRSIHQDFTNVSNGNGYFTFNNTFTSHNPNSKTVNGATTGSDLADMLLGYPTSGQVQIATHIALDVPYNALYFQDDYRVNDRLTITGGLRYEYEQGVHERNNHYAVGFDQSVTNPITATSGVSTKGGIMYAGVNGYSTSCCDYSKAKFAPRIGFAYSINHRLVARGGYGIFYVPTYYTSSASYAPGFVATTSYVASNNSNFTPANSLASPYTSINQPSGNSLGYSQGLGDALATIDQKRQAPYMQEYSFDIETELPYHIAFMAGYVGSKGDHLSPGDGATYNINQINLSSIPYGTGSCPASDGSTAAAFLSKTSANPYYNTGGIGAIAAAKISNAQLCKPFPEFTSVSIQPSSSRSLYNALVLKAEKHMSSGISILTAMTWSHNFDATFGQGSTLDPGNNGPQDMRNIDREYSRAVNDIPLRYTFAGTYRLPFGKDRRFLSTNRWLDHAVGGWDLNATFLAQQGGPLPIVMASNENSLFGNSVQRPNLVSGVSPCTSGSVQQRMGQNGGTKYLNIKAFSDPGIGNLGNAPRTLDGCRGPGYKNMDASIFKDFHLERVTIQFRAEAFNVTNTPLFAVGGGALAWSASSTSFGVVSTSAINFPRLISLGGRVSF